MTPSTNIDSFIAKPGRTTEQPKSDPAADIPDLDKATSFTNILADKSETPVEDENDTAVLPPSDELNKVEADETALTEIALGEVKRLQTEDQRLTAAKGSFDNARTNTPNLESGKDNASHSGLNEEQAVPKADQNQKIQHVTVAQQMVESRMPTKAFASRLGQLSARESVVANEVRDTASSPELLSKQVGDTKRTGDVSQKPVEHTARAAMLLQQNVDLDAEKSIPKRLAEKEALEPILRDVTTDIRQSRPGATAGATAPMAMPPPLVVTAFAQEQQMTPTGQPAGDAEIAQALLVGDRPTSQSTQQHIAAVQTHGAETARQVAHQLSAAITHHSGRITEIALNPEELGRVRLAMTSVDSAITLSVSAERPETVDLLRRHIDVLAQEFRDLGYNDISFSFGDDATPGDTKELETPEITDDLGDTQDVLIKPATRPLAGLDLRL